MTDTPALEMVDITKTFPGVVALSGVSFDCRSGEVHAICGENGAGKSTLMNVLGGNYRADSGEVRIAGKPVRFGHPQEARGAGISVVHQELSLLPFRSVAENVFLGVEPTRRGLLDRARMRKRTAELLARVGGDIDPDTPVSNLSIAAQQTVEIAKALLLDARILVLDEPTAALDEREAKTLLALVDGLRGQGIAIVYISHKMPELMALPDRITVLKDGQKVWTRDRADVDLGTIVNAMVGRDLKDFYPQPPGEQPGEVLLSVEGGSNAELHGIDLTLRAGEIVGIGGLEDSGKTALARAIFGDRPFASGTIRIAGKPHSISSPRQAIAAGIGYLPGDRKREGLVLQQSVRDNALLTLHANDPLFSVPDRGELGLAATDGRLAAMDVRAGDYAQPVGALSGGNQQKVILCRWLAQQCRILVFVEPTRGVDIAAKAAVYETMRAFADSGHAILVVSSELPELIGISDRLLAMHQGRIVGELPRGASEEDVMRLSVGLGQQDTAARSVGAIRMSLTASSRARRVLFAEAPIALVLTVISVLFYAGTALATGQVSQLSFEGIVGLVQRMVALGLVGLGQTFAILVGSIDLSVAALISTVAVLASFLMHSDPAMILPAVVICLALSAHARSGQRRTHCLWRHQFADRHAWHRPHRPGRAGRLLRLAARRRRARVPDARLWRHLRHLLHDPGCSPRSPSLAVVRSGAHPLRRPPLCRRRQPDRRPPRRHPHGALHRCRPCADQPFHRHRGPLSGGAAAIRHAVDRSGRHLRPGIDRRRGDRRNDPRRRARRRAPEPSPACCSSPASMPASTCLASMPSSSRCCAAAIVIAAVAVHMRCAPRGMWHDDVSSHAPEIETAPACSSPSMSASSSSWLLYAAIAVIQPNYLQPNFWS